MIETLEKNSSVLQYYEFIVQLYLEYFGKGDLL
jgi:hypothetical protein